MAEREEIAERGGGDLKPNSSSWVSEPSGVGDVFTPKFPLLISVGIACAFSGGLGFSEVLESVGSEYPFSIGFWMKIREPSEASRQLGSPKKTGKTDVKDLMRRVCFSGQIRMISEKKHLSHFIRLGPEIVQTKAYWGS